MNQFKIFHNFYIKVLQQRHKIKADTTSAETNFLLHKKKIGKMSKIPNKQKFFN